jgi:hypothetical protein
LRARKGCDRDDRSDARGHRRSQCFEPFRISCDASRDCRHWLNRPVHRAIRLSESRLADPHPPQVHASRRGEGPYGLRGVTRLSDGEAHLGIDVRSFGLDPFHIGCETREPPLERQTAARSGWGRSGSAAVSAQALVCVGGRRQIDADDGFGSRHPFQPANRLQK